jgi:hypothetical protein
LLYASVSAGVLKTQFEIRECVVVRNDGRKYRKAAKIRLAATSEASAIRNMLMIDFPQTTQHAKLHKNRATRF